MSMTVQAAAPRLRHVPLADARPVDVVHDHVLRLLGCPEQAAAIARDVARRSTARLEAGVDGATSLVSMLGNAHARLAGVERPTSVDDGLAGPAAQEETVELVRCMATAPVTGAALLDLTRRHALDLRTAATVVGTDRTSARAAAEYALRDIRTRLADAGVGLHVDVEAVVAGLPVVAAPEDCSVPARRASRGVPPAVAWLGTGLVALATAAAVAATLPTLSRPAQDQPAKLVAELVDDDVGQLADPVVP